MALKANRSGVRTDQVDAYGRVISKSFFQSILDHLPRWTSLKVWKNGTEQLLPVNTDEPVTSPIVADIQYPTDSSATEQMFTYRESPTDADGEAYIQSIKGNTIVWNQQKRFNSYTNTIDGLTLTSDENGLITITGESTKESGYLNFAVNNNNAYIVNNHIYLIDLPIIKDTGTTTMSAIALFYLAGGGLAIYGGRESVIVKNTGSTGNTSLYIRPSYTFNGTLQYYLNLYDLTQMFGSTKAEEILAMETAQAGSGVAYFKSLFPLPYYQYDAGSLLSFNGTGIKTTGKNLFTSEIVQGALYGTGNENNTTTTRCKTSGYIEVQPNTTYVASIINTCRYVSYVFYDSSKTYISGDSFGNAPFTFTTPSNCAYVRFGIAKQSTTQTITPSDVSNTQLEIGSSSSTYEPYTTSTTTIPTDTYFPTGMKRWGNAYDEFTSSRAYTRMREIDMGAVEWQTGTYSYYTTPFNPSMKVQTPNIVCDCAVWVDKSSADLVDGEFTTKPGAGTSIWFPKGSYETASAFKTAMTGHKIQYELAEEIVEPTLDFGE